MEVQDIPLRDITVSSLNTRKDMKAGTEDAGLRELASSIQQDGLLSPVTVRRNVDGSFDLIAGQRRFLACQHIGMDTIPAVVHDEMPDHDALVISLVENVHRADMNPIDKARAYKAMHDQFGNYGDVSKRAGVTTQTVRKYLSLLDLTPSVQEKLSTATGPAGLSAMSQLAQVFSAEQQEQALSEIAGFRQDIQVAILKRSGGELGALAELRKSAMEGAFDVQTCHEGLCFQLTAEQKAGLRTLLESA